MYVPSFDAFLARLNLTRDALEGSGQVTIPASLLKLLIQVCVATSDFDEEYYLEHNPDVAEAYRHKALEDVRLHYVQSGFFECRRGGTPRVDEAWYEQQNPDVRTGIRAGAVASASEHFLASGALEGRCPGQDYLVDAGEWDRAFGRPHANGASR